MKQYLILILFIVVILYTNINRDSFINFNHTDFKVVGGTLSNRVTTKDYGIIQNIKRTFYGKYYKTADIEYNELKEIITKFEKDFKNRIDYKFIKMNKKPDITKINRFIMGYLNKHIKEYLLKKDIQIINSYNIINNDILYSGQGENHFNYRFILSIFRFGTDMYFNIYFDIISGKLKDIIKINSLRILGIKMKTDTISEEYNKCILDNKYCNIEEECSVDCNSVLHNVPNFRIKLNKFIRQIEQENIKIRLEGIYNCYKKFGKEYILYSKLNNKAICEDNKGVWDRPCISNSECPFYTIYKYGGCVKGSCEFPWGIEPNSPRTYNTNSEPLCKGCGEGYRCCDEQSPPNYIFMDSIIPNLV